MTDKGHLYDRWKSLPQISRMKVASILFPAMFGAMEGALEGDDKFWDIVEQNIGKEEDKG